MAEILRLRLILRLFALTGLVFCFVMISRNEAKPTKAQRQAKVFAVNEPPILITKNDPSAPLVISLLKTLPSQVEAGEIAFNLTNVSDKSIRAYVIREIVEAQGKETSSTVLVNLDLSNRDLGPNYSAPDFLSFELISDKQHHVTLGIEYVEFSDGKSWGSDTNKFVEQLAGQRTALQLLSKRINKTITPDTADLSTAIDNVTADLEAPRDATEAWKEGFNIGRKSFANRLKRAQAKGGWVQIERELHQLTERFKGAK